MIRVIVRISLQHIVQHVDVSTRILVRKVAKHLILQSSVETFDDGGFQVFVFARVKVYVVTTQHGLKRRIQKLGAFVTLHHGALLIGDDPLESCDDVSSRLCSNRHGPRSFGENVDTRQQVPHAVVKRRQIRQVNELSLIHI